MSISQYSSSNVGMETLGTETVPQRREDAQASAAAAPKAFQGLFSSDDWAGLPDSQLVSVAGGVGDKLNLAFTLDKHDTVGIDCVAMCVNDLICSGARPLYFLHRLSMGKAHPEQVDSLVSGLTKGCRLAGCAFLGGDTAQTTGLYGGNQYDLSGFSVGIAPREGLPDGSSLRAGDILLGLGSSGLHTGGYSLACKVLDVSAEALDASVPELGGTLGEALLQPSRIYALAVQCLLRQGVHIRAIRHISGGLLEDMPGMMPQGLTARVEGGSFPVPPIFGHIAEQGHISWKEMCIRFNMGVGLVLAIPREEVGQAKDLLCRAGERAYIIGSVVPGDGGVELT